MLAASGIITGKFCNSGQTCIAPDYVLVERHVRDEVGKPVGIVQGRSLWVSEMDPESHCCQKVADVSCLLKVGFASSLRNFAMAPPILGEGADVRSNIKQPKDNFFKSSNQVASKQRDGTNSGYQATDAKFRILNTFLDLPTLPQQVVAKLKQATLEMLGEGADAAQKMTRMINPEVGASWTGMILIKNSAQVDSLTIFKPFSNHLKSPSIPAFPWPAF